MLGKVDLSDLEGGRRVRTDEGAAETHSFVAVQVSTELCLRPKVALEQLLNLGYSDTTSKKFDLVYLICSYAGLGKDLLNRLDDACKELSRCLFELLALDDS